MLLRSDALAGCCIAFLPVDGVDDVPKLYSLFSRCVPVVNISFMPSLRRPVGRFLPGLETLDKWIGRREAGIVSLTLNACLLLDSGVLESVVVFSAAFDVPYGTLIFWRGLSLLLGALEIFAGSTGLRIDLVVDCFRLRAFAFGVLLSLDASVIGWFRSTLKLALFDRP